MSPDLPNQPPADPPCGTIVYRTIRRKEWFDPDDQSRVKAEAFARRRPKIGDDETVLDPMDQDGLSVYDSFRIGPQECIEDTLSCHGLATLHVGTLRTLGLIVVRDPADPRKILVTNMPFENPNDADQEALLDSVSTTARIAARRRWRRP